MYLFHTLVSHLKPMAHTAEDVEVNMGTIAELANKVAYMASDETTEEESDLVWTLNEATNPIERFWNYLAGGGTEPENFKDFEVASSQSVFQLIQRLIDHDEAHYGIEVG